jgi:hypothetical protein
MKQPGLAAWIASSGLTAGELATIQPSYPPEPPQGCAAREANGLGEGPVALGYAEADVATGRRACPRTELGIGGRFGAIIDTPDFYGALNVQGVVFGSYALRDTTELFATLEAVSFTFAQNAVLTSTQITLGNMTAGATQVLIEQGHFVGGVSARILLPTSFEIPGARLLGGHVVPAWGKHYTPLLSHCPPAHCLAHCARRHPSRRAGHLLLRRRRCRARRLCPATCRPTGPWRRRRPACHPGRRSSCWSGSRWNRQHPPARRRRRRCSGR